MKTRGGRRGRCQEPADPPAEPVGEAPPGHLPEALASTLSRLPREPGVYLLKDQGGKVLYVGKAKVLSSRVRSYFSCAGSGDSRAFVPLLPGMVRDIETIVTHNEKEALLLENTLIKKHRPRFNVMLRDDKSYLVLRLDPQAPFPRLEVMRRMRDDGARYFGPFHSATACRQTLRLVNRHFQLRTCSDRTLRSRARPCLQHQIHRCPGPCVHEVDAELYAQQVRDVTLLLRGQGDELVGDLERRMHRAASALDFEQAARLRDQIAAVRRTLEGQHVVGDTFLDQDVFGFHREGDRVDVVVLLFRQGKLVGRRPFSFSGQELPDEEVLSHVVSRYYDQGESAPRQILLPLFLEDAEAKQQWLSELRGEPVEILVPRRGERRRLLDLARRNARSNFETRRQRDQDMQQSLDRVQRRLKLTRLPRHIECFDISSLHGRQVVASMVVLRDGEPQRSGYRRFKITADRSDDFAAMYEVLARRLRRAREGKPGWKLPDLLVVDGGRAHLAMALAALRDADLPPQMHRPDVVALAKERPGNDEVERGEPGQAQGAGSSAPRGAGRRGQTQGPGRPDRVYLAQAKDPIRLRPNTAELFLLARVRDEAHRFAVTYHTSLRQREALRSGLQEIPGIGPVRRQRLLRALGSLRRIREASVEELRAVPGMTGRAAEEVAAYFSSSQGRGEEPEPPADGQDGGER